MEIFREILFFFEIFFFAKFFINCFRDFSKILRRDYFKQSFKCLLRNVFRDFLRKSSRNSFGNYNGGPCLNFQFIKKKNSRFFSTNTSTNSFKICCSDFETYFIMDVCFRISTRDYSRNFQRILSKMRMENSKIHNILEEIIPWIAWEFI